MDADGTPNMDAYDTFKFLDPGTGSSPKVYYARLTLTLQDGTKLRDMKTFQARTRTVFWTSTADSPFEAFGKTYMWRVYGKEKGSPPVCQSAAENDSRLFFDPNGKTFAQAYDCVPPRGLFYGVAHGASDAEGIRLDGPTSWWYGFQGPASDQGTKGGTSPIYDLAGHAEMHKITARLLACYTHRPDAQRISGYDCNVGTSFKESIEESVGGGGSVIGYTGICQIWPGNLKWQWQFAPNHPWGLNQPEIAELGGYTDTAIKRELNRLGAATWYDEDQQVIQETPGAEFSWTTGWIDNHTFNDVDDISNPGVDCATITSSARGAFDAAHPGHAPYGWTVTAVTFLYVRSAARVQGSTVTIAIPGNQ